MGNNHSDFYRINEELNLFGWALRLAYNNMP